MIDATRLHSKLYMGSVPRRGPALAQAGFKILVLCAAEYQPRLREFPGLKGVIHAPLDDQELSPTEIDTALQAAFDVTDHVLRQDRVLVTCMAGRNRSGLVSALALHLITCRDPQSCVLHIKKHRIGLDGGEALTNDSFVDYMKTVRIAC
jgi:protein-tyrosine phosphatase